MTESPDHAGDKPWNAVDLGRLPSAPGPVGGEERQFLHWFAREAYSGSGEIVELGALLGASTTALAAGLAANAAVAAKAGRIHSFDPFEYVAHIHEPMMPTGTLEARDDTRPVFQGHLGALSTHVTAIKGDIGRADWSGPIDLLFVDFTQNWFDHQSVIDTFYPHLTIGGVLVHRGYNYVLCYWLHVFMERYGDCFEVVAPHIREGSAAWRLVKPLPSEALMKPLQTVLDAHEMLALIDRSHARYATWQEPVYLCLLACQRARFFLHAFGRKAARAEAAKIPDIHPVVAELKCEIEAFDTPAYESFFS